MLDSIDEEMRQNAFLLPRDIAKMTGYLHAHRRVYLGSLNQKSLSKAALELTKISFENDEPITILLQSDGGEVIPTQQFQDAIKMIHAPVDVVVIGDCCSMAVDLVQMCRKRMILPSARMLTHFIRNRQQWIQDDVDRLDKDFEYFRATVRRIYEQRLVLYERRTGLTRERILDLFRHGEVHGAYFTAEQCLELNLVDEIITDFKLFPKKDGNESGGPTP